MRDLCNDIKATRAISPAAATTDNTAWVSQIADLAGFSSATLVLQCGSLADADATFALTMDEGDQANLSDASAVAAGDLIGTLAGASFVFSDDDKTLKIGYRGTKRYIRATVTPSANTGNAFLAGVWILGHPSNCPQSSQKV